MRVGGSKTFTVSFFKDEEPIDHDPGSWSFTIDGEDASELLSISYPAPAKAKVVFKGDDTYIGKILTITNTSEDVVSSYDIEIIAL